MVTFCSALFLSSSPLEVNTRNFLFLVWERQKGCSFTFIPLSNINILLYLGLSVGDSCFLLLLHYGKWGLTQMEHLSFPSQYLIVIILFLFLFFLLLTLNNMLIFLLIAPSPYRHRQTFSLLPTIYCQHSFLIISSTLSALPAINIVMVDTIHILLCYHKLFMEES